MRHHAIITTALCALLGAPLLTATEAAPTAQQVQEAINRGEHPFFQKGLYPDWSRLTPAQARIDSAAAMVLARHRLEQIARIQPENATFENTFLAFSLAQEELDKLVDVIEKDILTRTR